MKKVFVFAVMICVGLFVFAGCGNKPAEQPADTTAPEKVVIKIAHVEAETDTLQTVGLQAGWQRGL